MLYVTHSRCHTCYMLPTLYLLLPTTYYVLYSLTMYSINNACRLHMYVWVTVVDMAERNRKLIETQSLARKVMEKETVSCDSWELRECWERERERAVSVSELLISEKLNGENEMNEVVIKQHKTFLDVFHRFLIFWLRLQAWWEVRIGWMSVEDLFLFDKKLKADYLAKQCSTLCTVD